jgi:AraC-like DNA-binding protein
MNKHLQFNATDFESLKTQLLDYKHIVIKQLNLKDFMLEISNFGLLGGVKAIQGRFAIPRPLKLEIGRTPVDTSPETFTLFIISNEKPCEYFVGGKKKKEQHVLTLSSSKFPFDILLPDGIEGSFIGFQFSYEQISANINNYPLKEFRDLSKDFPMIEYFIGQLESNPTMAFLGKNKLIHSLFFNLLEILADPNSYSLEDLKLEEVKKVSAEKGKVSIADLSKIAGMSQSQLKRKFKTHEGVSLRDYAHDSKMKHSLELLKSNRSVKEIANKLGYTSQNSFSRAFKQYYGYSPTESKKNK